VGSAGDGAPGEASRLTPTLLLLDHHFRRFDNRCDGMADLQVHLLGTSTRDDAFDFIVANLHDYVRHYIAELHVLHLATKLVACRTRIGICLPSRKGFTLGLSFSILVAQEASLVACAECDRLWKDYADASLQRVRAYGNLKLASLRSDSETMEMLAEALATATEQLEEVKRKIREHDSTRHAFQKPTRRTG